MKARELIQVAQPKKHSGRQEYCPNPQVGGLSYAGSARLQRAGCRSFQAPWFSFGILHWVLLIAILPTFSVFGQSPEALGKVRETVGKEFPALHSPGLSVAVAVSNVVCWSAGFGHADLEAKRPATSATIYRYASISKPIAATAVMQLVEQSKVSLDAPVQEYVPSFPEKSEGTITTRHLLTHTSGIRHYRGMEFLSNRRYESVGAALGIFKDDPLEFTPGTKYQYSSHAYNIVAAVVEQASARSFRHYLKEEIFHPAGMTTADLEFLEEPLTNRCRQYLRVGERFIPAPTVDLSCKWAGGGMAGTAEDLVRFCTALDQDKLLKPGTRARMYESATLADGSRTGYGLGWRLVRDKQRRTWTTHSGGATGGSTYLLHNSPNRIAVALLANAQDVKGLDALALRLGEMLLPGNQAATAESDK